MKSNYPKVLIISSLDPISGPGAIGKRMYDILKECRIDVDMLTLRECTRYPEIKYIFSAKKNLISVFKEYFYRGKNIIIRKLHKQPRTGYFFFYRNEKTPPIPSSVVLSKINKEYDIVIVYFWQNLLSFKTISDIYDKIGSKFIFICADYSPMSGGCHFTSGCEKYKIGCGSCPAFNSKNINDFTHKNVLYRELVYKKVKPIICGNNYMIDNFFKKSYLLKDQNIQQGRGFLDINFFKPLEKQMVINSFDIPQNKKYILSIAYQSLIDIRKGISYLIEALNYAYSNMTEDERNQTLILAAGNDAEEFKKNIKFDFYGVGYLKKDDLPTFYSVSTVFLNTTINDAGPSTLKQSLACGTPLISFEMGAALDVLKNKNTGYCVNVGDVKNFGDSILKIIRMDANEYLELRNNCRMFMIQSNSKENFVNFILDSCSPTK